LAQIVCTMAVAHAPGLTGWLDTAPPEQQKGLKEGYAELGRMLRESKPDVILGFSNDHILNLPLDNTPDFCIGTAPEWVGPAPWFRDWLNIAEYRVGGNPQVARTLVKELDQRGVAFAFRDDLLFDDNFSVPLTTLTPKYDIPLVPVHMNCIVPPVPSAQKCFDVGAKVAEVVRDVLPANLRVAILGTGGLSHDPGGPRYFQIDEAFDRWFLSLMESGDPKRAVEQCTLDRLREAGDGGTPELLAWFVPWGAAKGAKGRVVCYEPTHPMRCGMGGVVWN
jgi:aromatic ring-opening dioxygenase catalytic subunit (LigB family)